MECGGSDRSNRRRVERFQCDTEKMHWHGGANATELYFTLSLPASALLSHAELSSVPNGATSFCVGVLAWLQAQNHRVYTLSKPLQQGMWEWDLNLHFR